MERRDILPTPDAHTTWEQYCEVVREAIQAVGLRLAGLSSLLDVAFSMRDNGACNPLPRGEVAFLAHALRDAAEEVSTLAAKMGDELPRWSSAAADPERHAARFPGGASRAGHA